jgi:PAS domain S-box-containing protein
MIDAPSPDAKRLVTDPGAAIIAVDLQGRVTNWAGAAETLYGWPRDDVLGRRLADLLVPDAQRGSSEEIVSRLLRGEPWQGEFPVRRRDGSVFTAWVSDTPLRDADGRVVGAVGVSLDAEAAAGDRRRAQRALRRIAALQATLTGFAEARQVAVVEAAALAAAVTALGARSGALLALADSGRPAVLALVGAEAAWAPSPAALEALRSGDTTAVPADAGAEAVLALPLRGDGAAAALDLRFAAGQLDPEELLLAEIVAGHCAGAVAAARRLSEEQGTRQVLERERAWLAAVVEQLPVGVSILEAPSGRVLLNNRAALAIWRSSQNRTDLDYESYVGFHADGRRYRADEWPAMRALRGEVVEAEEIAVRFGDGTPGHISASASPIRGPDGNVAGAVLMLLDLTEQKRAERSLRFLAEASDLLAQSLDERETLERLVFLVVPALADWCSLDLVEPDGSLHNAGVAHVNPDKVRWAKELQQRYPPRLDSRTGTGHVVRTGRSELFGEISDELLVAAAEGDEELLAILRELDLRSAITAPLNARGRTLGALTLIGAESGRRYDRGDLELAEDLAHRAALAIDNARVHADEQASRRRAELLEAVAASLARAATRGEIAEIMARAGVEAMGASAAWVGLLDGRMLRHAASVGYPEALASSLTEIPLASDRPAATVVREDVAYWFPSSGELRAAYPHLVPEFAKLDFEALAMVPLRGIGRMLGFLSVHFAERHEFGVSERDLVTTLAAQCSQALERAALYEREQHAAETLQRALLPPKLPQLARATAASRYRAAAGGSEVGGDFYDVWEVADGSFGVAIGDVCGKGSEAAALTALARHTVRTASLHEPTPSRVLRVLNDGVLRRTSGERFCTVAYAYIRPGEGDAMLCTIACGGHPPPVVVRATGEAERIGRPGTLIGVFPTADVDVADCTYDLHPGDLVLFFTDGVTERRRRGEIFGESRLMRLASELAGADADALARAVDERVLRFGHEPHQDDIAILALRLEPAPAGTVRVAAAVEPGQATI